MKTRRSLSGKTVPRLEVGTKPKQTQKRKHMSYNIKENTLPLSLSLAFKSNDDKLQMQISCLEDMWLDD